MKSLDRSTRFARPPSSSPQSSHPADISAATPSSYSPILLSSANAGRAVSFLPLVRHSPNGNGVGTRTGNGIGKEGEQDDIPPPVYTLVGGESAADSTYIMDVDDGGEFT